VSALLAAFGLCLSGAHVLAMGVVVGWRDRVAWALTAGQVALVWLAVGALAAGASPWIAVLMVAIAFLAPLMRAGGPR